MSAKGKAFRLAGIKYLFEQTPLLIGEHDNQGRFGPLDKFMDVGGHRPGLVHYFEMDMRLDMEFVVKDFFEQIFVRHSFVGAYQV